MKDNYGNLRRRTRDSSWQWLLMGAILGLGLAAVVCVGGYALGAVTFPALEDATVVKIEPNQTEVAFQSTATQQALLSAQQTATGAVITPSLTNAATEAATPDGASPSASLLTPSPLPGDQNPAGSTPQQAGPEATNLPGASGENTAGQTAAQSSAGEQSGGAAASQQETPVVGTPPVGQPTQTLTFASAPSVPSKLDAIKTELVAIDGGTFMMGTTLEEATAAVDECALYGKTCDYSYTQDSTPTHQVTLDSFQMELYEVTTAQYVEFLNFLGPNSHKNGCGGQPCALTTADAEGGNSYIDFDGTTYSVRNPAFYSNHPVTYVTWWGADVYCTTLNRRLPTEAEWERAARGPENRIYPWGFEFDTNLAMSSAVAQEQRGTVAVNSYPLGVSSYGIFNMAGNVEEWVSDWYLDTYYSQIAGSVVHNPLGPATGTEKVLRGGSWDTAPLFLRSVHRRSAPPGSPTGGMGFRCAASASNAVPLPSNAGGANTGGSAAESTPAGVPTLAPRPTNAPAAPATPSGPTPTLSPG